MNESLICPCCGQPIPPLGLEIGGGACSRDGASVHLPPQGEKLLQAFADAYPEPLSYTDLCNVLYGGGDQDAAARSAVLRLRDQIGPLKLNIEPTRGAGFRLVRVL